MPQEYTDAEVDKIISDAYSPQEKEPILEPVSQVIEKPTQKPVEAPKTWEINWKGQKIAADEAKLVKWAHLGYDYSQNISQLKNDRQTWEQKIAPYREIDDYARSNPTWWDHVKQAYQNKDASPSPATSPQDLSEIPPELKTYLEPIVKDYSSVKNFINDYQKEKIEKQTREEDTALQTEIKSIQEKYPNLDFVSKDESGASLEQKVINHAVQNGFPTFRSAFLDFYHDSLEKLAEARGKESFQKGQEQKKKLGLLETSQTPFAAKSEPYSVRGKSWNDVHQDALRDLNLI